MRRFRRLTAFACVALSGAMAAEPAQAQSGLFYFVPTGTTVSTYTSNSGGTPTSTGTISGGGATNAFMSLVRGDQAFAYQTYGGGASDSLQVINTATGSVVQTVAMTQDPQGMAISPNGSTLYVANNVSGANTVSVFSVNATTGMLAQTGTIDIGAATRPRVLAVSPDGTTLYTVNQGGNTVSVVNLATNTVTTSIAVGTQPVSIAINPTGTRLYVGNATSGNVTVINTATNAVLTTVSIGVTPISIAVSRNGQYFYVAAQGNNTVRIFDAATNAQVGTAGSASSPTGLVISPDGSTLYVANNGSSNGQAFTIDPSTGLLTSLGFFATGVGPAFAGMCGTGSSAGGMLGSGGTFLATSNSALSCAGSSATVTGGTILVGAGNLALNTPVVLAAAGGTIDTNGNNTVLSGAISGAGGLSKTGLGVLTLSGLGTYTGATLVNMGTLQAGVANAFSASSAYTVASGAVLGLNGFNQTIGSLAGAGAVTLGGATLTTGNDNTSTSFSGVISGAGGLTKIGSGTLTLSGTNTFTGGTVLNAGGLVVNGSLASGVTVNGGTLGGNGTFAGLTVNGGTLAPGNSIGTFTVNGNFAQGGGSIYQVEVNPQGQSDLIAATGTATISGGTVAVQAQSGTYARNTTYTILTAAGGVSGAYSSVTSNFAFLTPSLSYNANNVFLTLFQNQSAFAAGAQTANQYAVGAALDQANASAAGDFNTVLNALSVLSTAQGPWALNAISGQPYADFGTFNVANNALFMNALGQQMALARGSQGSGQRQALAEACDVAACDGTSPFSVWGSVLGGVGSVQGDGNSSTFTYNVGGGAAGIDYRLSPSFLVGLGAGYSNGTQWVDSFQGKGWSNSVSVAAYASFTQSAFYLDALAGYAYSNNQLQRQISVPGLQPRTANGSTGANQFLAQAEAGYSFGIYAPAAATVTPFARFQTSSINQAAFQEWGANSLSLAVQQQTTTSVRTVLGAELAGAIGLGDTRTLDLGLRLGWLHEYANTARPITAAFAGAPSANFTVYGATPQRDAAVIGFQASTTVAATTQLYLRYDGDIGSGTDNHALNLGLRLSW